MSVLDLLQNPVVVQYEEASKHARGCSSEDCGDLGGDGEDALLSSKYIDDCGQETSDRVEHAGPNIRQYYRFAGMQALHQDSQEDAVDQPDVILPPPEPQPAHPQTTDDTACNRKPEQANVSNRMEDRGFDLVAVIFARALESLGILEACECSRYDKETGQQHPGEDACKDVM